MADVVDPLGGSYFVENLTSELESRAFEYIERIDQMGGAVNAIEQGYQVMEIGESAYRMQQEVDAGSRIVVGVNRYVTDSPPLDNLLRVDAEAARQQIARLTRLRGERDGSQAAAALSRLRDTARGDDNTVPAILECVDSYCTLGEICQVFRDIFGEQRETAGF